MKLRWISGSGEADETYILLGEFTGNLIPEWRVLGYVMPRQIYQSIPATYFAFGIDLEYGEATQLGAFVKLCDARVCVQRFTERA